MNSNTPEDTIELVSGLYLLPGDQRLGYGYSQFIKHPAGNILLPRLGKSTLLDCFEWLHEQGGVQYLLGSDRHFCGPGCLDVTREFGPDLVISDIEAKAVVKRARFQNSIEHTVTVIAPHILAIPVSGHTKGQFCYLIDNHDSKDLFTGDFIYWRHGNCVPGSKSIKKMLPSLDTLREFEFDRIIGCVDYDAASGSFIEIENPDETLDGLINSLTKV